MLVVKDSLLAFDPGETIGWCTFWLPGEHTYNTSARLLAKGHVYNIVGLQDCFEALHQSTRTVVYEGFSRGNTAVKPQIETIELVGAIKAYSTYYKLPAVQQYPAERKGYIKIAKAMVGRGNYERFHHAIDAIAHAIAFCEKEGLPWDKQYWIAQMLQLED